MKDWEICFNVNKAYINAMSKSGIDDLPVCTLTEFNTVMEMLLRSPLMSGSLEEDLDLVFCTGPARLFVPRQDLSVMQLLKKRYISRMGNIAAPGPDAALGGAGGAQALPVPQAALGGAGGAQALPAPPAALGGVAAVEPSLEELEGRVISTKSTVARQFTNRVNYREFLEEARKAHAQLSAELSDKKKAHDKLSAELSDKKKAHDELSASLTDLQTNHTQLAEKVERLKKSYDRIDKGIPVFQEAEKEAESRLNAYKRKHPDGEV